MGVVLDLAAWRAEEARHEDAVDELTAGHLARRRAGRAHPVEDFLFTYYHFPPARLRRWHPGAGVVLADAATMPRASWRHYRVTREGIELDVADVSAARGATIAFVRTLLTRTVGRPAHLGCFGLHEWAMVYRQPREEVRHAAYPLRLGAEGTDAVVEGHALRCTHFDAFRFFTPEAVPRNAIRPSRESQAALEQPGCLHAGMDVYKWAFKLTPLVPSSLVLDAFRLAREIRTLDMRASPYDLTDLGYTPVRIETPAGKAAYIDSQREFGVRTTALRRRLLDVLADAASRAAH